MNSVKCRHPAPALALPFRSVQQPHQGFHALTASTMSTEQEACGVVSPASGYADQQISYVQCEGKNASQIV